MAHLENRILTHWISWNRSFTIAGLLCHNNNNEKKSIYIYNNNNQSYCLAGCVNKLINFDYNFGRTRDRINKIFAEVRFDKPAYDLHDLVNELKHDGSVIKKIDYINHKKGSNYILAFLCLAFHSFPELQHVTFNC